MDWTKYKSAAIEAIAIAHQLGDKAAEEIYSNIMNREHQIELDVCLVNGREVVWYLDGDGNESAIDIGTLESVPIEVVEEKADPIEAEYSWLRRE